MSDPSQPELPTFDELIFGSSSDAELPPEKNYSPKHARKK